MVSKIMKPSDQVGERMVSNMFFIKFSPRNYLEDEPILTNIFFLKVLKPRKRPF